MPTRPFFSALLGLLWVAGCQAENVDKAVSELQLRYMSSCTPTGVDQITLEALGDFPADETNFASLDAQGEPVILSSLPLATRLFRVNVRTSQFLGVALAPAADDGERFDALVLPLEEPCLVLDRALTRRPGAAASLLGGHDLWIAGGFSKQAIAVSNTQRVSIARQNVASAARLFVPRAFGLALEVGTETWIVGGAQSELVAAPAFDSFERYDQTGEALLGSGRLARARMEAGSVVLADGSALIAGGSAQVMGPPLDTLERVSADGDGELSEARLPFGARHPRLLLRDDGLVVIAQQNEGELSLSLYDPISDTLELLAAPSGEFEPALVVTLPGARIALVETESGATTSALWLIDARGNAERLTGSLTSFAGLQEARALALRDGRILLTGSRSNAATSRILDPGTLTVRSQALPVLPDELFLRGDGAVVLLAESAVAAMRTDTRSPYDHPAGTLLAEDEGAIALDSRDHWMRNGLALRALSDGARLDLAGLSFTEVRIEIEASGQAELLIRRINGDERGVEVGDTTVGPALCTMTHTHGARVTVERSAERIAITSGSESQTCVLDGLDDRIALGVRVAQAGTELRFLSVERR